VCSILFLDLIFFIEAKDRHCLQMHRFHFFIDHNMPELSLDRNIYCKVAMHLHIWVENTNNTSLGRLKHVSRHFLEKRKRNLQVKFVELRKKSLNLALLVRV